MKTVATFSKPEDAQLAKSRLEGSGVAAHVRDEHTVSTYWLYSNAIGGVRLDVDDADVARAREILELPPLDDALLECPHCGSHEVRLRELSLWAALSIALSFVLPVKSRWADCIVCKQSFTVARAIASAKPDDSNCAR